MSRLLFRGGCVLTLGAKTPNFTDADVLVEDDRVAEIGRGLRARDAETLDATNTIVMPGFVDTHRHTWTSLFRNLGEGASIGTVPASAAALGAHLGPDDLYAATLIGLWGAAEAGITTVVDWSDLPLDDRSVDAVLQAHSDAGLRTVFVSPATREGLTRLTRDARPNTTVALGSEGLGHLEGTQAAEDWAMARELGVRIFVHAGPEAVAAGTVAALASAGLLRDDVTLVHPTQLDDADLDAIATTGAAVSLAPSSEMTGGGSPPIQQMIDRDIRPGLGVDDEWMSPGDLFAQMRATISLQHATVFDRKLAGKAGLPRLLSTRDVIRYATVDGARAAGLGAVTGSLEPGKQADVIVLRTDRPNVFPINDPIGAVVWGMDTSNVQHVVVAGRFLMRDGALMTDVTVPRMAATAALQRVAEASGLVVASAPGGER